MPAPLPVDQRRSEIRHARFTVAEAARLRRAATLRGITIAALIREAALTAINEAA